ncbi:hypothetical protein ACFQZC_00010 [Streptacidiphilus monticola]
MRHRQNPPPGDTVRDAEAAVAHSAQRLERVHRRGRAGRVGVWVALACGPLALFASCAAQSAQPVRAHTAQPPVRASAAAQDPAGYAQLIVGLWLRAAGADSSSAQVGALHALAPALTPPSGQVPVRVEQVAAVRSVAVGAGSWAVTVAADLTPAGGLAGSDAGQAGAQVRYFQLPVQLTGAGPGSSGTLTVAGSPAEVGAPTSTAPASSPYTAGVVPASPLAQTVAAFAQALLAGSGDLTPLLSPARTWTRSPHPLRAGAGGPGDRGPGRAGRACACRRHHGPRPGAADRHRPRRHRLALHLRADPAYPGRPVGGRRRRPHPTASRPARWPPRGLPAPSGS